MWKQKLPVCIIQVTKQTRGAWKSSDSESHSPAHPEKLLRNLLEWIYTTLGVLQPLPTQLPKCVSWELGHVPRAAPQPCSCDSELLAQALDRVSQISRRTRRDCLAGSCCSSPFILCHSNVCSFPLNPLEVNDPEINLVLSYPGAFGTGWWS